MIIDSHVHLWLQDPEKYPWNPIGGYIPEGDASLERFLHIMDDNHVESGVLVQPTPYGWDNSYLLDCKKRYTDRFKAVVLVDPFSENALQTLEILKSEGVDGLRINLHLNPIETWRSERFYRIWKKCADLRLPVCLQITPAYLNFVRELVQTYYTKIVIDHLGRPIAGTDPGDDDFRKLLDLADYSHVYIKLSGMNYYSQENAPYKDTWKLLKEIKKSFGAKRCLWGSDFPFVEEHWHYENCLETVKTQLDFSEDDLDWILGKTAESIWW